MSDPRFLQPADWEFPVPLRYGPGRLAEAGAILRATGARRPLVVTDSASGDLPFIARLLDILRHSGATPALFAGISPNPTDTDVECGRQAFCAGDHDAVIAIGGGSGMDGGKAVSLVARTGRPLWEFDFDNPVPDHAPGDFPPLICIPTTAGTGAETESTAMVTDTVRGIKGCVWHPRQKPRAAILDPDLTLGLPATLTAWTGCDALVHAIEAYVVPALHPMCDAIALEALALIATALPEVQDTPSDVAARGALLTGSCLAGVSFLKGLGLVHAISHMVGAEFDTHHGLTNAVILPVVLRFNADAMAHKVPALAQAMGLPGRDFAALHHGVCRLLDRCGIPKSLADLGVAPEAIPRLAAKAARDPAAGTNPRPVSEAEIAALIAEALAGARP
jgi:alcohol dehydrogenase class IV